MPIGFIYPDVRMPLAYHHRCTQELIRWKPDVIHSQCDFFSYQFALYISKHTSAPIVHTYHTLYELVFLIVGDGPAKAELETLATELGVKSQVIFTGMVPPTEVQNYYQLGDIFVSASTSETQGLAYIEEAEFLQGPDALLSSPEVLAAAGKKSETMADAFDKKAFGAAIESIYDAVI